MKRGLVLAYGLALAPALLLGGSGASPAWAQMQAPQCGQFQPLSEAAAKKAAIVQAAMKSKADRKEVCVAMTNFVAAEAIVVKFLVDNKTWCGVPPQVVASAQANHEKSIKFKTAACTEGAPAPKPPSLSDALGTPTVDSASNTKTGRNGGTFDTLTGNPLGR